MCKLDLVLLYLVCLMLLAKFYERSIRNACWSAVYRSVPSLAVRLSVEWVCVVFLTKRLPRAEDEEMSCPLCRVPSWKKRVVFAHIWARGGFMTEGSYGDMVPCPDWRHLFVTWFWCHANVLMRARWNGVWMILVIKVQIIYEMNNLCLMSATNLAKYFAFLIRIWRQRRSSL